MSEQHSRQVGKQPQRPPLQRLHECPPVLAGDCANVVFDEFLRSIRRKIDAQLGEGYASPDIVAAVVNALATEHGATNVAAYLSCAISNAGSEIAESVNRLARAVENYTPAVEPPTLVRLRDVARRIGLSSDSIMRMSLKDEFPKPVYLDGIPFFRESDVNDWLTVRAA
jgi:predicted DNA-binding transcriptional regulator AlpA